MIKPMSEYDDLLKKVRAEAEAFRSTAKEYIPKMYYALRREDQNISAEDVRDRIEKDCIDIWSKRTILDALPDEAKNQKKQEAGKLSQKERNSAAVSAAQYKKEQEIIIDNKGKPFQNGTPKGRTLMSSVDHPSSLSDNSDYFLDFEFPIISQNLWDWLAANFYKDEVWFSGIIDRRSGEVISTTIGRKTKNGTIKENEQ